MEEKADIRQLTGKYFCEMKKVFLRMYLLQDLAVA